MSSNGEHRYGADPATWTHFMALTRHLFPVVANPDAPISPASKIRPSDRGKVPSRYNRNREIGGVSKWNTIQPKLTTIAKWMLEPDYGICIATHLVRGIDVDVPDAALSTAIRALVIKHFGILPVRARANSSKFLAAITLPGNYSKRKIAVGDGAAVEFLAGGQQFIADSTHQSGVRYEWEGGLPAAFPEVSAQQFESFWSELESTFSLCLDHSEKPAPATAVDIQRLDINGAQVIEGHRNDFLFREGCAMRARGDTEAAIEAALQALNEARCNPSLDAAEVTTIAGSASKYESDAEGIAAEIAALPPLPPLFSFIDFASLATTRPPARRWVSDEWFSRGKLTLFSGGAGFGKTQIVQQLQTCIANGIPWLGIPGIKGRTLGLYCEDDKSELLFRQDQIFRAYGLEAGRHSAGINAKSRVGLANILVSFGADRLPKRTPAYNELVGMCEQVKPVALILDNSAQMYGGLENDRPMVTAFCNELSGLALRFDMAVVLLAHPAKMEGSQYSGSTAWEAAVRARLFLERKEDGSLTLKKAKANYSGLADIDLEYRQGIITTRTAGDHRKVLASARAVVLSALATFTSRQESCSHADRAQNNLAKLAAKAGLLDGVTVDDAKRALGELIDQRVILPNAELPWRDATRHKAIGLVAQVVAG
jgi:hypothetical protein